MTWIEPASGGETDWDRLASLAPDIFDALAGCVAAAWQETDPDLLELARLRIAALLGNPTEAQRRCSRAVGITDAKRLGVASWPTSPAFTETERDCLALTEQFVIDANGVTDAQLDAVSGHLGGRGCYAFVAAVSVLETSQRAALTMGIRSAPGPDELIERAARARHGREATP